MNWTDRSPTVTAGAACRSVGSGPGSVLDSPLSWPRSRAAWCSCCVSRSPFGSSAWPPSCFFFFPGFVTVFSCFWELFTGLAHSAPRTLVLGRTRICLRAQKAVAPPITGNHAPKLRIWPHQVADRCKVTSCLSFQNKSGSAAGKGDSI